jgi:hypothetical protein
MSTRHTIAMVLALGFASTLSLADESTEKAAKVPSAESAQRACSTSAGAVKKECKKVAAQIDAQSANPQPKPTTSEETSSSTSVHHSSPVMATPADKKAKSTPEEKARVEAKERKQPAKE